jgi:hypothetical protein
VLVAGIQMNVGSVGEFLAGTTYHFLQMSLSFIEFPLLQGAKSSLVVLHSLCKLGVIDERLPGRGFLGHL